MSLNFQDVIRDVHDPINHALQTSSGGATIFAVVNTGAAGVGNSIVTINPRTDYIGLVSVSGNVNVGLPTVTVGNETLYAVVNVPTFTGVETVFVGTPTINAVVNTPSTVGIGAGVANIGFATVSVSNPTIYAVVNTSASSGQATVNINGSATIFAVVNTAAAGVVNSMVTINPRTDYIGLMSVSGNVAVSALPAIPVGTNFIGLATVWNANQPALAASPAFIGIVSVANQQPLVASTVNIGSVSVLGGGIGLNAGVNNIGFATVTLVNQPALVASSSFIGIVTIANQPPLVASTVNIGSVSVLGGGIGLNAGVNGIGFATVKVDTGTKYVGLATVDIGTIKAWTDPKTYIGLASVNVGAIAAGANFVGLVSVQGNVVTGGTNKSLKSLPIAISASGNATIFVPTATFKVTHLVLGSDATVRVNILSGPTYLTGNASVGITLLPGGGWVENGAPASPIYVGVAAEAGFVVNTSAAANVGGKVIYFDE